MDADKIAHLILLAPGALLAISLHEASHGFAAYRLGDGTAKFLGRLTLNPFKHIDPIGTILVPTMLFMFGGMMFGWAKPVPVNTLNLNNPKRDMALVAAAGPASNLVIAIIASLLMYLTAGILSAAQVSETVLQSVFVPLINILFFAVLFNLFLMLFNLIPVPPLDGGRILVGLLPDRQARAVAAVEPYGFFILIGLIFLGVTRFLWLPMKFLIAVMVPNAFYPYLMI
jgi:Zn-dependent protease